MMACDPASSPEDAQEVQWGDESTMETVVTVDWLKQLIDYGDSSDESNRPPTYHNDRFVIVEASWGTLEKASDYRAGHIPGAIHVNTDDFENGYPMWRLRDAAELQQAIGRAGITADTTVIVYGKQLIAAARVWWVMKYAGVADVRLLDGGYEAWRAAGYAGEKHIRTPQPQQMSAEVATDMLATTAYVRDHFRDAGVVIADVRSEKEFLGLKSGYSYLDAKGRIPSAVHVGDGDDEAFIYKQRNGKLRPPAEILDLWVKAGIVTANDDEPVAGREVVFYCGGGWRSSVTVLYATLLGIENVRNYSDGWSGWSTEYQRVAKANRGAPRWKQVATGNPIATGVD